jgi:arginyl-tRNA--protein-N-Asp/Glu arginylyltransferase
VLKVAYVEHGSQFMAITREQFKAANKRSAAFIARAECRQAASCPFLPVANDRFVASNSIH